MKRIYIGIVAALIAFPAFAQVNNGKVTTAAPTYVSGAVSPLSLDTAGNLRVAGSFTPAANQSVNLAQILGAAPSLTNPLWVFPATGATFPVSGTFWQATQPVSGTFWQATQPVSIASLPALPANQSVNVAQINAVTPLMGNGATGTGSQRVTIANDSSAIAVKGEGATGATVPTGAQLAGAQSGANMVALIQASASVAVTMSTATTTQFVALSGSTKIYVTSFDVISAGASNVTFVYGTGSNCGAGTTSLTGAYPLTAQAGIAKGSGLGPVLVVPAGNALCVTNSASVQISGSISYTQF